MSVNPKRAYAIKEIDRCVDEHRVRGLKLQLWNSIVDVRDEAQREQLQAVVGHAASRDLPVVVHAFNGFVRGYGPRDVEIWATKIVEPTEGLRICFAHLGGGGGFAPAVQAVTAALIDAFPPGSPAADRVVLDMSAVLVGKNAVGLPATPPAQLERMATLLEAWGLVRVLWGSDNIPGYLEQSRAAWPLTDDDWAVVCRQTGEKLINAA